MAIPACPLSCGHLPARLPRPPIFATRTRRPQRLVFNPSVFCRTLHPSRSAEWSIEQHSSEASSPHQLGQLLPVYDGSFRLLRRHAGRLLVVVHRLNACGSGTGSLQLRSLCDPSRRRLRDTLAAESGYGLHRDRSRPCCGCRLLSSLDATQSFLVGIAVGSPLELAILHFHRIWRVPCGGGRRLRVRSPCHAQRPGGSLPLRSTPAGSTGGGACRLLSGYEGPR